MRSATILPILFVLTVAALARGQDFTFDSKSTPAEVAVKFKARPLMVYSSDPQKYKSYVKELWTLQGQNILRDAPFDHLHHHALMYGIKVNGVNFWEETSGSGVQKVISNSTPITARNPAGDPSLSFSQVLHWVAAQDAFLPSSNAPALLVETRTLTLSVNEPSKEVALRWKSSFRVPERTNAVLTGSSYHGLGLRFQQELDPTATHFFPGGRPDLSGTKQDVSAHPWEAVAFESTTAPATIAVLGHSQNPRGAPNFFSMKRPFAYLAATQGLEREPLVYPPGSIFSVEYLVLLWPAVKSEHEINERARLWSERGF